jgi:hypothetical protein
MKRLVLAAFLASAVLAAPAVAFSAPAAPERDLDGLFAQGTKAMHDGRAGDAINAFEALADEGVVDASASYDRGLAYATRVRIGAELPGDLGRAAQGFEEARSLSHDPRVIEDASRALTAVRGEVARRRLRAGQPADVDAGRSLARAVAGLVPEDVWAGLCAASSLAMAAGLFARWRGSAPRVRVAGGIAAGVATPALAVAMMMTLAARHDRLDLREAVVVTPTARPTDERGITRPGETPLPEGALVEVIDEHGPSTRVRFGAVDAWVPSGALRNLARLD